MRCPRCYQDGVTKAEGLVVCALCGWRPPGQKVAKKTKRKASSRR